VATIMRDVVPGWQLINIISISSIIFYERTLSRSLSLKKKNLLKSPPPKHHFWSFLKKSKESSKRAVLCCTKSLWQKSSPFFSPFCLCALKTIVSQSFSSVLSPLCCAFFHSRFSFCSIFFFFGARVLFFSTTSATTFDSSLKQTREKTLKPFSLFSFLSLILITLLSHFYTKAEKTNTPCSF
jgi:hypothetical protein